MRTTQFFSTSDDVTFDETEYMFFLPEECYVLATLKVNSEREIKLYCSSVALYKQLLRHRPLLSAYFPDDAKYAARYSWSRSVVAASN